jgi:hypothetical protein
MPHQIVKHDRHGEGTGFGARFLGAMATQSGGRGARQLQQGALDDAIRLVRFDQAGVCFDLISRHTEASAIDFQAGMNASLVSQPSGARYAGVPVVVATPPRPHLEAATQDVTVETGWSSGCDRDGCWSSPTYGTVSQSTSAAVYTSRALVCFANDGSLGPDTQALELDTPHGRFRWEFDAPATGWAQPVIVMEEQYVGPTNTLLGAAAPAAPVATAEAPVVAAAPVADPEPTAEVRVRVRRSRSRSSRR